MKQRLSVIIPVYNVEKYLAQCLDSVIAQTMQDLEIICVNDGSTDSSPKILQEYAKKDKRIKIVTQQNGGLSAARNSGLRVATCDYVTFLDSDDWIAPDFYEILYNNAIENDADISCGNTICYESNHNMWFDDLSKRVFDSKKTVYITPDDKRNVCCSWACWNKIYKRELVVKNNLMFYQGKLVEDFPFTFLACALANKIVVSPFANLYYRQNPNGIMRSKQQKCAFDVLDNCMQLRQDFYNTESLKNNSTYQQILDNFIFNQYMMWTNLFYSRKYLNKFRQMFRILTHYDTKYEDVFDNIAYKCLRSKILNKLFFINIRSYKIEFWLFGFLPVLKIKWYGPKLLAMLFCAIPIWKIHEK